MTTGDVRLAKELFGPRFPTVERYAELLVTVGVLRGLIGPREANRIWGRHLINCALLAELIPRGSEVIDVGSGAGLPGIVLAIRRPDLVVHLVEPLLRRVEFLREAVERLGLSVVTVHRGRAEQFAGVLAAPVVVARAVAPLVKLVPLMWPLRVPGGVLLAMKGVSATREIAEASAVFKRVGVRSARIVECGHDIPDGSITVVEMR
jgi:16S rRNA (guanine527-N7)-methyltransferase